MEDLSKAQSPKLPKHFSQSKENELLMFTFLTEENNIDSRNLFYERTYFIPRRTVPRTCSTVALPFKMVA